MSSAANTLFHFTGKNHPSDNAIDIIISILKEGFRPSHCPEVFEAELTSDNIHEHRGIAFIPMVCFCDIKLTQIKDHTARYGRYGLGLSKDFTERKKVTPVHYFNLESDTQGILSFSHIASLSIINDESLMGYLNDIREKRLIPVDHNLAINIDKLDDIYNILQELRPSITKISAMQKPVEGFHLNKQNILSGEKYIADYISFYEEREWRYIPELNEYEIIIQKDQFIEHKNDYKTSLHNKNLKININKDINYIILDNKNELETFSKKLENDLADHKDLLLTKVRFLEEIENDF